MDKLTKQILSGYFPHKLQWIFEGSDNVHEVIGLDIGLHGLKIISPYGDYGSCNINDGKPILRPLSDLEKEIEHNGEKFVPMDIINELRAYHFYYVQYEDDKAFDCDDGSYYGVTELPYDVVQKLLSWHFDIHNLIEKGLAVDINSLKS